ncbi:MAG: adenylyltransferase/cytidyltransferase family protein [Candidatus Micrarchaeota archaeon]
MENALFIGRFQPFHKGHEKAISYLLKKYKKIKIAIGSSQFSRTKENPFSARQRLFLLKKIISSRPKWKKRISFAFLPDNPSNAKWTKSFSSRFSSKKFAICSANPLVNSLLKKAGYKFDTPHLVKRIYWQGKKIRDKIRKKKSYLKDIPNAIKKYMKNKGEKIISTFQ